MQVEGIIKNIIFKSGTTDYIVAILDIGNEEYITIVGNLPMINIGDTLKAEGTIESHKTYGEQLKIVTYEKIMPTDGVGLVEYLSNGSVKGIGIKTAQRIVKEFGEKTLDVIRYETNKLIQIKGMSQEKADQLKQHFVEEWEIWNLVAFLQKHGLNISFASKIYKVLGNDSIKLLQDNPYKVLEIVSNADFADIDKIAMNMGIDVNNSNRVDAGVIFFLKKQIDGGHTCSPKDEIMQKVCTGLYVDYDEVENSIYRLCEDEKVYIEEIDDQEFVYKYELHKAEQNIANKLAKLTLEKLEQKDYKNKIKKMGDQFDIELSDEQINAIETSLNNNVTVITGGPGTGKTTIIKVIIEMLKKDKLEYVLCAPTGRAAKRITQTTGEEAKTLHRLLEIMKIEDNDMLSVLNYNVRTIDKDYVIIDEMSMVDVLLMNNVIKALNHSKIILVGDVDQLSSVGAGSVLRDIIESETVNTVKLNHIYRQSKESDIVLNAHKINKGEHLDIRNKDTDFYFLNTSTIESTINEILSLVTYRIKNFKELDPIRDIQVLSPLKKGDLGTKNLNIVIQNVINPKSSNKKEKTFGQNIFRQGDKIMQMKNNYDLNWELNGEVGSGIYNGDIGYIEDINIVEEYIKVKFEDNKITYYFFNELDQIELAYAVTIHKSQGSEFPCIIMPSFAGPSKLFTRNLIYTAVTRAKDMLILVGSQNALNKMIDSVEHKKRYTGLRWKLINKLNEGLLYIDLK